MSQASGKATSRSASAMVSEYELQKDISRNVSLRTLSLLRRQPWFFGEVSEEAATAALEEAGSNPNLFLLVMEEMPEAQYRYRSYVGYRYRVYFYCPDTHKVLNCPAVVLLTQSAIANERILPSVHRQQKFLFFEEGEMFNLVVAAFGPLRSLTLNPWLRPPLRHSWENTNDIVAMKVDPVCCVQSLLQLSAGVVGCSLTRHRDIDQLPLPSQVKRFISGEIFPNSLTPWYRLP